jgi:hypothetical protein
LPDVPLLPELPLLPLLPDGGGPATRTWQLAGTAALRTGSGLPLLPLLTVVPVPLLPLLPLLTVVPVPLLPLSPPLPLLPMGGGGHPGRIGGRQAGGAPRTRLAGVTTMRWPFRHVASTSVRPAAILLGSILACKAACRARGASTSACAQCFPRQPADTATTLARIPIADSFAFAPAIPALLKILT